MVTLEDGRSSRPNQDDPEPFFRQELLDRIVGGGVSERKDSLHGYTLLEKIGEGGMGEVWRAHSGRLGTIAVKLLRRAHAHDATSRRRFVREARAIQSIAHPGIVEVHEVGATDDGRPFIAMELVEGRTLRDFLEAEAPIAWSRALALWTELAEALQAAHDHGILHRDVKPTNVLLQAAADGTEHCRVIDFGLVRALGPDASTEVTTVGQVIGTPSYISPEALRGDAPDARSDQYSLGCVAYELLEARRPFRGAMLEELFLQHLTRPPPPPELPRVPAELRAQVSAVLRRCLEKEPAHRFADMRALVRALAAIRPGARPVRRNECPRARRSSLYRWGAVLGTVALVVGLWSIRPDQPVSLPAPTTTLAVASGAASHITTGVGLSCALSDRGEAQCWGADSKGRLGRGTRGNNVGDNEDPSTIAPLELPARGSPVAIVGGPDARHVCVLLDDGRPACWGSNGHGELGLGSTADWGDDPSETVSALPRPDLPALEGLALGDGVSCGYTHDGTAYCWGKGDEGVRGDGTVESVGDDETLESLRPVALGEARVLGLTVGTAHACARVRDPARRYTTVRCWGSNDHRQLGVPDWSFPIGDGRGNGLGVGERPDDPSLAVGGLEGLDVVNVQAAGNRTCVVTSSGGVRCWGGGAVSVLGYQPDDLPWCAHEDDCDLQTPPPFDLPLGAPTVTLALGAEHACAIDPRGNVRCWGNGTWGTVGDGQSHEDETRPQRTRPAADRIIDLGDFDKDGRPDPAHTISAANWHTCALMRGGGVRCWGRGITGRLGYKSSDNVGDNETPAVYYQALGYADVRVF